MSKFVHELVSKMTMREKGYFRSSASMLKNKNKNYLLLYNFVEKNLDYNLEKTQQKFSNVSVGKHLSSVYKYLGEQLLKSLVNFHHNKKDTNKIQKHILHIKILIEKDLKVKSLKVLRRTKKIAYENEYFTEVLSLINLEEELLFRQGTLNFTDRLNEFNKEREILIKKINNLNQLRLIREQIREFQMRSTSYSKDSYPDFFYNSLLESQERVLSIRGMEHWLYILAVRHGILRNYIKSNLYFLEAITLIETHSIVLNKRKAIPLISNYLFTCAILKDKKSFFKLLPKLEILENDSPLDKAYFYFVKYIRLFELYYKTDDYGASKDLEKDVIDFIEIEFSNMEFSQVNYIYFCLMRSCILTNRYEKAMDWLNKWNLHGVTQFLLIHLKLFSLIIHFELEMNDLIQAEIETTYKSLKRNKKYNVLTKSFLKFFRSTLRTPHKKMILLEKLASDLSIISESPNRKLEFSYYDYTKWVEQQIKMNKN